MKAILLVALLAFAVTAFDVDAYTQGFTAQLGFTGNQTQDTQTCFMGVSQIIGQIQTAAQSGDQAGLITALLGAKAQFQAVCAPFQSDLFDYAITHTDGQTGQEIFQQYFPEIVQQFALWVNYLAAGQDLEAGQTEAYILQILSGSEQPATLPDPQFNFTLWQQFNLTTFLTDYFGEVFDVLGINQQPDIGALVNCIEAVEDLAQSYQTNTEEVLATADFSGKLDAIQAFADNVLATVRNCQGAFATSALILGPQYDAFMENPANFLILLNNVASNLPELIHSFEQERVDIFEGNYTGAGAEKAFRIETDFKGIVNY